MTTVVCLSQCARVARPLTCAPRSMAFNRRMHGALSHVKLHLQSRTRLPAHQLSRRPRSCIHNQIPDHQASIPHGNDRLRPGRQPELLPTSRHQPSGLFCVQPLPQPAATQMLNAQAEAMTVDIASGPRMPNGGGGGDRDREYNLNVGQATDAIHDDIPALFKREPRTDIFCDHVNFIIQFSEQHYTLTSLRRYKLASWMLRLCARVYYKEIEVHIMRLWQPDRTTLKASVAVTAQPRLQFLDGPHTFQGVFQYQFDKHGKIYEHLITNIIMSDPPLSQLRLLMIRLGLFTPAKQQSVRPPVPQ